MSNVCCCVGSLQLHCCQGNKHSGDDVISHLIGVNNWWGQRSRLFVIAETNMKHFMSKMFVTFQKSNTQIFNNLLKQLHSSSVGRLMSTTFILLTDRHRPTHPSFSVSHSSSGGNWDQPLSCSVTNLRQGWWPEVIAPPTCGTTDHFPLDQPCL